MTTNELSDDDVSMTCPVWVFIKPAPVARRLPSAIAMCRWNSDCPVKNMEFQCKHCGAGFCSSCKHGEFSGQMRAANVCGACKKDNHHGGKYGAAAPAAKAPKPTSAAKPEKKIPPSSGGRTTKTKAGGGRASAQVEESAPRGKPMTLDETIASSKAAAKEAQLAIEETRQMIADIQAKIKAKLEAAKAATASAAVTLQEAQKEASEIVTRAWSDEQRAKCASWQARLEEAARTHGMKIDEAYCEAHATFSRLPVYHSPEGQKFVAEFRAVIAKAALPAPDTDTELENIAKYTALRKQADKWLPPKFKKDLLDEYLAAVKTASKAEAAALVATSQGPDEDSDLDLDLDVELTEDDKKGFNANDDSAFDL